MAPLLAAEAGNIDATSVGAWLLAFASILAIFYTGLGVFVHLKKLRAKPRRPSGQRYVTREEVREKLQAQADQIRELKDYTHSSVHELRDDLNAIRMAQAAMHREVLKDLAEAKASMIAKLEERFQKLSPSVERILAIMESPKTLLVPAELQKAPTVITER